MARGLPGGAVGADLLRLLGVVEGFAGSSSNFRVELLQVHPALRCPDGGGVGGRAPPDAIGEARRNEAPGGGGRPLSRRVSRKAALRDSRSSLAMTRVASVPLTRCRGQGQGRRSRCMCRFAIKTRGGRTPDGAHGYVGCGATMRWLRRSCGRSARPRSRFGDLLAQLGDRPRPKDSARARLASTAGSGNRNPSAAHRFAPRRR